MENEERENEKDNDDDNCGRKKNINKIVDLFEMELEYANVSASVYWEKEGWREREATREEVNTRQLAISTFYRMKICRCASAEKLEIEKTDSADDE